LLSLLHCSRSHGFICCQLTHNGKSFRKLVTENLSMQLSLDGMTLTNTKPVDLIRSAKAAGFDQVSLWLQPPSPFPLQLLTPAMERECAQALAETGIRVRLTPSGHICRRWSLARGWEQPVRLRSI
jgi:hypothetical protein